jgi:E3 ubiquitin-protein ligase UBR4
MTQHWYYCHTCQMVDRIGCCTSCAKVCHAGHDVSYAKYGSFFCDCGAKEDNSCLALKKRDSKPIATLAKRSSSPQPTREPGKHLCNVFNLNLDFVYSTETKRIRSIKTKQIEDLKQLIVAMLSTHRCLDKLKVFINGLFAKDEVASNYDSTLLNTLSSSLRSQLDRLKKYDKSVDVNEQLFIPTLGSQEGSSLDPELAAWSWLL